MKKLLPVVALLCGITFFSSCDKGNDNPVGNWRCTCFVESYVYLSPSDTVKSLKKDTVYLNANNMDQNTAKTYCQNAKSGFADTVLKQSATCTVK